ncbi:MAG TPA: ATP-binding protein [Candidatus Limnocylindria bacterium]|nr:ATP-binding protein [Candidatus Limnocylindria bacterium]
MTDDTVRRRQRGDVRWRTAVAAIAGLLVGIAVVGVVGIVVNRSVHDIVERAVTYDIELEDNADDLRVAVLDVRHYHRNMLFDDLTEAVVAQRAGSWEERYEELQRQLDELAELYGGLDPTGLPSIAELQDAAQRYHDHFAPAVSEFDADRVTAFQNASDRALEELSRLESLAADIDVAGERRAASAFAEIDAATTTGIVALLVLVVGIGAVGGGLGVAVLRMLREQRRVAAAEHAAARQLAEVAQAKTDFIADASHELRTPLTVLRGNAEIGLAMSDGCGHGEILREIVDQSSRMSRLVDDLLFLARSDTATPPLELAEEDAGDVLRRIVARAEVLVHERGARLASDVTGEAVLLLDAARLEQAVLILVDNAAKYGPPGGTVEVRGDVSEHGLTVSVGDHGPGIPEGEVERIFDRFYRVRRDRARRAGGTGIGLSIARAIVEGHGGTISVRTAAGAGTTMEIRAPARLASEGRVASPSGAAS